jgi:translation initiation factor IF-2
MYTRQAAQERTAQQSMDRMPAGQQARVEAIKQRLESATRHISPEQSQAPIPADNSGSREAMRQNMTAQEKAAPALSPTSAQVGKTAEKSGQAPSEERAAKGPARPSQRPQQTLPRRPPSWER